MTLKRRDTERSKQHWDFVEQVSRRVQAERPTWMEQRRETATPERSGSDAARANSNERTDPPRER